MNDPDIGALNLENFLIVGALTLITIRIVYCIRCTGNTMDNNTSPGSLTTPVVLGSGGHTAEMLNLLTILKMDRFTPRYYIAAATDNMSLQKARLLEESFLDKANVEVVGTSHFMQIYRSREVGQSNVTSIGTTLIAIAHALWLIIKIRPQVVLFFAMGRELAYLFVQLYSVSRFWRWGGHLLSMLRALLE